MKELSSYLLRLEELVNTGEPFVVVTVVDVVGSVPQKLGARMFVNAFGRITGTVGGGKVEQRLIEDARELLASTTSDKASSSSKRFISYNLQQDIGMTCGGSMRFYLEAYNLGSWQICIFGAGHCSQALSKLLVKLDCTLTVIDTRSEWLEQLPTSLKLKKVLAADYLDGLKHIPAGAFVLLLSRGHSTDSPVLLEIFKGYSAGKSIYPYLGVIGSKAKRHKLVQDLAEHGLSQKYGTMFHCPVGLPFGSNDPEEIALSIAGQLLSERDRLAQD
jgi:xanthine dehydrogenase accessory factor